MFDCVWVVLTQYKLVIQVAVIFNLACQAVFVVWLFAQHCWQPLRGFLVQPNHVILCKDFFFFFQFPVLWCASSNVNPKIWPVVSPVLSLDYHHVARSWNHWSVSVCVVVFLSFGFYFFYLNWYAFLPGCCSVTHTFSCKYVTEPPALPSADWNALWIVLLKWLTLRWICRLLFMWQVRDWALAVEEPSIFFSAFLLESYEKKK